MLLGWDGIDEVKGCLRGDGGPATGAAGDRWTRPEGQLVQKEEVERRLEVAIGP
jgi:hypothetical protein